MQIALTTLRSKLTEIDYAISIYDLTVNTMGTLDTCESPQAFKLLT